MAPNHTIGKRRGILPFCSLVPSINLSLRYITLYFETDASQNDVCITQQGESKKTLLFFHFRNNTVLILYTGILMKGKRASTKSVL